MKTINRSIATITPKLPFKEWANRTDNDSPKPLDDREWVSFRLAFLLPEPDNGNPEPMLRAFFPALFEEGLSGWVVDENLWPAHRSYEMFREWFDVAFFDLPRDLCPGKVKTQHI